MTTINKTEITSHNQSGGITGNHVTLDHESKQENIQNNNKEKKGDHWIGRVIMLIAAIVAILAYFKIDFS